MEGAGIEVAGTATRGDELLDLLDSGIEASAVLLDLNMPGGDGFECMEELRRRHPDLRMIVVSATDDEQQIRRALDAGAVCFIGKAIDPNDLAAAVRALLANTLRLDARGDRDANGSQPAGTNGTHHPGAISILTRREIEILRLTAVGLSNSQMAKELWVTEQTVKFHLSNIYRKIDALNRTEASRWAQQNGVLVESQE